jgi:hypothetical protein
MATLDDDASGPPVLRGIIGAVGTLGTLVGLGIAAIGVYHYARGHRQAIAYRAAEERYQRRRVELAGEPTAEEAAVAAMRRMSEPAEPGKESSWS